MLSSIFYLSILRYIWICNLTGKVFLSIKVASIDYILLALVITVCILIMYFLYALHKQKSINEYLKKHPILNDEHQANNLSLYENMDAAFALLEIVTDKNNQPIDFIYRQVNLAFTQYAKVTKEQVLDKKDSIIFPNNNRKWIKRYGKVALSGKSDRFVDYSPIFKKYLDVTVFCPKSGFSAVIYDDITRKILNKHRLQEEIERNAFIIHAAKVGTWDRNIKDNTLTINERWAEILGFKLNEIAPVTREVWINTLHPDDLDRALEKMTQLRSREIDYYNIEFRQKHKNGYWVWIQSRGNIVKYDAEGNAVRISGTHLDITERKEVEKKIVAQRDQYIKLNKSYEKINKELKDTSSKLLNINTRFEKVISGAKIGTFERNVITDKTIRNDVAAQIIGYTIEELGDTNSIWLSRVHPEDLQTTEKACALEKSTNIKSFDISYRIKHKKGHWIWVQCKGDVTEHDKSGYPIIISGITMDITERMEVEKAFLESSSQFKTIFEKSKTAMLIIDPDTKIIVDANESAVRFYGYSKSEFYGLSIKAINKIDPAEMNIIMKKAMQEDRNFFKFKHSLKSGEIRDVEVYTSPISVNNKNLLHSIIIDITQSVEAEYQIKQVNQRFKGLEKIIHYNASSINDLLDYTLSEVIEYTHSDMGAIYHYDKNTNVFYLNNWSNDIDLIFKANKNGMDIGRLDCLSRTVKEMKPIIINNPQGHYPFANMNNDYFRSISIPIIYNGEVNAVVWLASKNHIFSGFHAEQVMLLLETTWILVENQKLKDKSIFIQPNSN